MTLYIADLIERGLSAFITVVREASERPPSGTIIRSSANPLDIHIALRCTHTCITVPKRTHTHTHRQSTLSSFMDTHTHSVSTRERERGLLLPHCEIHTPIPDYAHYCAERAVCLPPYPAGARQPPIITSSTLGIFSLSLLALSELPLLLLYYKCRRCIQPCSYMYVLS